ncbi:hypothetical protein Tco_0262100 [Tanacetum coccineum]
MGESYLQLTNDAMVSQTVSVDLDLLSVIDLDGDWIEGGGVYAPWLCDQLESFMWYASGLDSHEHLHKGEELVDGSTDEVPHLDEEDDRSNEYDWTDSFIDDVLLVDEHAEDDFHIDN